MKKTIILASVIISGFASYAIAWPDGQITFHVTDESGNSLTNMPVEVVVFDPAKPPANYKAITSLTDMHGLAVVSASNLDKEYSYSVEHAAGFYSSGGLYAFDKAKDGRWQPWNPTVTIVLRPKLNPIPMYARHVRIDDCVLPENDKPIGFDLMVGDWVTPYGRGMVSDMVFELHRQFTNVEEPFDATLNVTFPNDGDGVQSIIANEVSQFSLRLPRTAPETGYQNKVALRMYKEAGKKMVGVIPKSDQNYFFHIRTKKDEKGKIVSTLYGKIHNDIGFDIFHNATAHVTFTYYLNPSPNSRNMEFDPKKNLFKNLKPLEQVTAP